jgi:hypothetical protein
MEVCSLAGNVFTRTDPKMLCLTWKKCRENRILCDLSYLRGERSRFMNSDIGGVAFRPCTRPRIERLLRINSRPKGILFRYARKSLLREPALFSAPCPLLFRLLPLGPVGFVLFRLDLIALGYALTNVEHNLIPLRNS